MAEKRTHDAVNYREGHKGARCRLCVHFVPPAACTGVQSPISPSALCDRFKHHKAPIYESK